MADSDPRNRLTHFGSQPISSVRGLEKQLNAKQEADPKLDALAVSDTRTDAKDGQIAVFHGDDEAGYTVTWRKLGGFGPKDIATSGQVNMIGVSGGGGATTSVPTRTALAAAKTSTSPLYLTEGGREGMFVWSSADHSADVTADPNQGVFVPATGGTGASGAWVRKYNGPIQVDWFGTAGDDSTNDGPVALAALALAGALLSRAYGFGSKPAATVEFGPKAYYLGTSTLNLDHTIILQGQATYQGTGATMLRWAAGTTGIRVQAWDTTGASGTDGGKAYRGDGSIIRNLYLRGGFTTSEAEAHGIHLRARAVIRDCFIDTFEGDGIYVRANTGGSGADRGNATGFVVENVTVVGCRNGIYTVGSDANAGKVSGLDCEGCRQWGVNEQSLIGNSYFACQVAQGYWSTAPTVVTYSGNWYAVKRGQAAGASTNAPSGTATDNTYWRYLQAGGAVAGQVPTWVSGLAVREGGAYYAPGSGSFNEFFGCYVEGAQTVSYIQTPSQVWGGTLGQYFGAIRQGNDGTISIGNSTAIGVDPGDSVLTFDNASTYSTMNFRSYYSGAFHIDGYIKTQSLIGMTIEGKQTVVLRTTDDGEIAQVTDGYLYFAAAAFGVNHLATLSLNGATGMTLGYGGSVKATVGSATFNLASGVDLQFNGTTVPLRNTTASKLIGRRASGAGVAEEVTLGTGLSMSSTGTLSLAGFSVASQTGTTYTAVLGDASTYIQFSNAGAITFTIPPNSSVAFPVGTVIEMEQSGAGALSVAAGAGVTINSRGADLTLAGQYAVASIKKVATDTWTLTGDL
jgi:hypothetical protein